MAADFHWLFHHVHTKYGFLDYIEYEHSARVYVAIRNSCHTLEHLRGHRFPSNDVDILSHCAICCGLLFYLIWFYFLLSFLSLSFFFFVISFVLALLLWVIFVYLNKRCVGDCDIYIYTVDKCGRFSESFLQFQLWRTFLFFFFLRFHILRIAISVALDFQCFSFSNLVFIFTSHVVVSCARRLYFKQANLYRSWFVCILWNNVFVI